MSNKLEIEQVQNMKCPSCGAKGKGVGATTLHHLLIAAGKRKAGDAVGFRHCAALGCDVAYFHIGTATDDDKVILKDEVIVRIGTKETKAPRPVCYCFGHTWESIADEILEKGATDIVQTISQMCRDGRQQCSEKNPQGACCLGNVRRAVKDGFAAAAMAPTASALDEKSSCCDSAPPNE